MSNQTDTATLIVALRSIAECDPSYREAASEAADRLEQLAATVAKLQSWRATGEPMGPPVAACEEAERKETR